MARLRLEYRRYRLPFRQTVRTAHGPWLEREGLILRLEDMSGKVGYGEIAPIPGFPGTPLGEIEGRLASLGVVSEEDQIMAALPAGSPTFAVRSALQEIAGAAWTGPEALQMCALLPAGRQALEKVRALLEAGFRVFKWKVGVGEAADELALLDDLLGELPASARLRLDANGAWDRRGAERWLGRLADRPIEFLEQPIPAGTAQAEDLLLGLAGDYPTRIALDESLAGDGDITRWLNLGWAGVFVLKPCQLSDVRDSADRILRQGGQVVFSSSLETAIGARDSLWHAFAYGDRALAPGFGVWPLFRDSTFDGPALAPFLRQRDVTCIQKGTTWNALR